MWTNFEQIMNKRNLRLADVARGAGIPYSTLTDWKAGRYTPKADKIEKIANYLGVSVEYLKTGKEEAKKISGTALDAFENIMNYMGWIVDDANSTYEKIIIEKSGLKLETDLNTIENIAEKTAQFINNALLEVIQNKLSSDFIYPENDAKLSDSKVG